jgi:mannose-6-phosphate isomerase class I
LEIKTGAVAKLKERKLQIVAAVSGQIEIKSNSETVNLSAGQFCLVPASLERTELFAKSDASLLRVEAN